MERIRTWCYAALSATALCGLLMGCGGGGGGGAASGGSQGPAWQVTAVSPTSAQPGQLVTIAGTNLSAAVDEGAQAWFGDIAVPVFDIADGSVRAFVPPGPAGSTTIVLAGATPTGGGFAFEVQPPPSSPPGDQELLALITEAASDWDTTGGPLYAQWLGEADAEAKAVLYAAVIETLSVLSGSAEERTASPDASGRSPYSKQLRALQVDRLARSAAASANRWEALALTLLAKGVYESAKLTAAGKPALAAAAEAVWVRAAAIPARMGFGYWCTYASINTLVPSDLVGIELEGTTGPPPVFPLDVGSPQQLIFTGQFEREWKGTQAVVEWFWKSLLRKTSLKNGLSTAASKLLDKLAAKIGAKLKDILEARLRAIGIDYTDLGEQTKTWPIDLSLYEDYLGPVPSYGRGKPYLYTTGSAHTRFIGTPPNIGLLAAEPEGFALEARGVRWSGSPDLVDSLVGRHVPKQVELRVACVPRVILTTAENRAGTLILTGYFGESKGTVYAWDHARGAEAQFREELAIREWTAERIVAALPVFRTGAVEVWVGVPANRGRAGEQVLSNRLEVESTLVFGFHFERFSETTGFSGDPPPGDWLVEMGTASTLPDGTRQSTVRASLTAPNGATYELGPLDDDWKLATAGARQSYTGAQFRSTWTTGPVVVSVQFESGGAEVRSAHLPDHQFPTMPEVTYPPRGAVDVPTTIALSWTGPPQATYFVSGGHNEWEFQAVQGLSVSLPVLHHAQVYSVYVSNYTPVLQSPGLVYRRYWSSYSCSAQFRTVDAPTGG